jgi:hypothetical protein
MFLSVALVLALTSFSIETPSQPEEAIRRDLIVQLHREYAATTSTIDRLMIASKLVRIGDLTYRRWLRHEAEKAVRNGEEQPRSRFSIHFGPWKSYDPNEIAPTESSARRSPYEETIDVTAERKQNESQADMWRMFAFAASATSQEKRLLLRGLSSTNGLVSGSAALGLARLGDVKSIRDIKAAAEHHEEARPIFIEALVYLHDDFGTQTALELSGGDDNLIKSLQVIAESNHFDPFYLPNNR